MKPPYLAYPLAENSLAKRKNSSTLRSARQAAVTSDARSSSAARPRPARAAMPAIRAEKLNDGVVPVAVNTTHGPMGLTSALLLDRIIIIGDRIDEDVATRNFLLTLAMRA